MKGIVLFDPIRSVIGYKQAIKQAGYKVVAVYTHPKEIYTEIQNMTEEDLKKDCDYLIFDTEKEKILGKIKALPVDIAAVIPASEGSIELADWTASQLNLWGNPVGSSAARRDKGAMREWLKQSPLSCPDFTLCHSEQKIKQFAQTHHFPLIVKTPRSALTHHVYECNDLGDLQSKFHRIISEPDMFGFQPDHCIIEEFIQGSEYVVDTFSDGKEIHVTDVWLYEKINTDSYKNIYYNVISMQLDDPFLVPLMEYAKRIARHFEVTRGPSHIELKDDPKRGPTLIEIGSRYGGGRITEFLQKSTSFKPFESGLDVFLNGSTQIQLPIEYQKHAVLAYFPELTGGKVKSISGIEEIEKLKSYDSLNIKTKEGEILPPTTLASTSAAVGYFSHSDRKQLLADVEMAHKLFRIQF